MQSEWAEESIKNKSYRRSLSHLSSSLAFIFSRSFLLRTAPHYLNAWNRLGFVWTEKKPIVSVTYRNERISVKKKKNSSPYIKCASVTSLLYGPWTNLWLFYGLYCQRFSHYIHKFHSPHKAIRLFFVKKKGKPKIFGLKNVTRRGIRKIVTFVICELHLQFSGSNTELKPL